MMDNFVSALITNSLNRIRTTVTKYSSTLSVDHAYLLHLFTVQTSVCNTKTYEDSDHLV